MDDLLRSTTGRRPCSADAFRETNFEARELCLNGRDHILIPALAMGVSVTGQIRLGAVCDASAFRV